MTEINDALGNTPTTVIRKGRGKSQRSITIIDAAKRILKEIQPASVRAVCYRLFVEKLIPNMGKASTNKVGQQLVWAREQGTIPWEWIVDETRGVERTQLWTNPDEIINTVVRGYRRDYWQDQEHVVEVWSEKGTVRGTLAPVLERYGVTFRVMHGYGSATSLHDIAESTIRSDKPFTVFYVGDYDPSGLHMSVVDLPRRLERYNGIMTIERVALTIADIGPRLPGFNAEDKIQDPRHKWFVSNYGHQCWELDALSPVILREKVEESIIGMLDAEAWHHAINVEKKEVESMQQFAASWRLSISRPAQKYSPLGVGAA